jgi:hypothetical protein
MKGAIGLSPLTVFLAVLAGAEFMGPLGALLAIPFAAALQVIVADALRIRRIRFGGRERGELLPAGGPPWRSVLTQFLGEHDERGPTVAAEPHEQQGGAEREPVEGGQRPTGA